MIFVDANVPMYLIGGEHPHKQDVLAVLDRLVVAREVLVTSAEVVQEILHRYSALRRHDAIIPALEALYGIIEKVLPIDEKDVLKAKELVLETRKSSARDSLHAAVMLRHHLRRVFSFDAGFDAFGEFERICR